MCWLLSYLRLATTLNWCFIEDLYLFVVCGLVACWDCCLVCLMVIVYCFGWLVVDLGF